MTRSSSVRLVAMAAATGIAAVSVAIQYVHADTTCPTGSSPATAADVPLMIQAGIKDAKEGMCWNKSDTSVGKSEGEAKQYLSSILCAPDKDNYGGMGPQGTIQGLDGKFAVCAASFLKAANQQQRVCVKEGARSVAKQNEYVARGVIACKRGASCEHPRGIAIDVNVAGGAGTCSSYKWLHSTAPQFGLIFYMGCKDAVHFVPQKGGCNAGGTTPVDGTIPASNYDFPSDYSAATQQPQNQAMPWQGILNALKGALGQQSSSGTNSSGSSTQTSPQCSPQYICSNSTLYYQDTTCSMQVKQVCQYGCLGTACSLSATSTPTSTADLLGIGSLLSTANLSSDNSNNYSDPLATSLNTITDLASPLSNSLVSLGNAVPLVLNSGLLDSSSSSISSQTGGQSVSSILLGDRATSGSTFGGYATGSSSYVPGQSTSLTMRILDILKRALQTILSYLSFRFGV